MARHKWSQERPYFWRCSRCGMTKLYRPNPYARQWMVEFSNSDGSAVGVIGHSIAKTPACVKNEGKGTES